MSEVVYPSALPGPMPGTLTPRDRRAASSIDGPLQARARQRDFAGARSQYAFVYTPQEMAVWREFYDTTLRAGRRWFGIALPGRGGLEQRVVRYVSVSESLLGAGIYRVDAAFEQRGASRVPMTFPGCWWEFDDVAPATTFRDEGPLGLELVASPSLADVSTPSGLSGRAVNRGAPSNKLVYLPRADTTLDFGPEDSFSFGAWIRCTGLPNDGWTKGVIGRWAAPPNPPSPPATGFAGNTHSSWHVGVLNGCISVSVIAPGDVDTTVVGPSGEIQFNTWALLVGVCDVAAGKLRAGVDDHTFSEASIGSGPRNGAAVQANFIIGQPMWADGTLNMDFAQRQLPGSIDRGFITPRLLSVEDREWLFNGGAGRNYAAAVEYGFFRR